jgi:hypothetical protein
MRNFLRIDEGEIMANDIRIGMTLDDGGSIANKNKDANDLKQTLMQAGEAAKNIRVPVATGAARQGMAARRAAAQPGGGASDTNLGRGVAGATGASAKDFAAQAQGLGGLVHVYATFAANLYAVSAAFGALSKAADTTNIVKGLDQLGAQSGRALGALAKQMVVVTDGAISMQQAMTSTALASSGGMTNSAILRMTEVARKASLALGRDMPDSMDRLTKGIVKVQPELLDELGIMARVIPAQQAYAKAVGKSVSDLTEFEKRQAFANAVLDEGERKFSAISLQANPYSKILASTQNLIQTTLELVNTALNPLLNVLSSSPAALGLALAFIAKTLLSQALPAIGQWKKGLDAATETARKNVIETNAQRVAHRKNVDSILAEKTAVDDLTATKRANLAIESLTTKASAKTQRLTPETANAVDKEGLNLLEKQNLALKNQGDLLEKRILLLKNPAAIARNTEELNQIRLTTKAIEDKIVAGRAYEALEAETYSKFQYFTKAATDARKADAAAAKSQRTAISKATSEAYQKDGMSGGWKALTEGIGNAKKGLDTTGAAFDNNQKSMNNWGSILTKAAGIGIIAVGVFETLAAAISSIFIYIGVAVAAFALLDYAFGKNSKQAEAASSALDNLSSASEAANNVLKDLEARDPLYKISTAAMTAKANAILEVGDASAKAFKAVKEQDESASWFDRLIDTGKILIGSNLLRKASIDLARSVANSFKLASPGAETTKALKEIKDLTGIDPRDQEAFKDYLNDTPEKFLEIAPKVTAAMQQLGTDLSITASKGREFDEAFKTAGATFEAILVSMMPSDNLAKLGFETIDIAKKMGKALEDPTIALSKLVEISGDTSKLRFFSPQAASELYKASPQIKIMTSDISAYTAGIERLKQEEQDLLEQRKNLAFTGKVDTKLAENKKQQDLLVSVLDPLKAKIQPYIDTLNKEQASVFVKGAKLVADSIGIGFDKARLTIEKANAQGLGDTAQGIQVRASLEKKGIDIQIRQLDSQNNLSIIMDNLRIIEEERLVYDQQKDLDTKQSERIASGTSATPSEREKESRLSGELVNRRVGIEIAKEMQSSTLSAVMAALKSPVGSARYIAASIALPGAQQRAGAASQRAQFGAEKTGVDIAANYALMDHEVKVQRDLKATELERLSTQQQQIDIRVKNALYLDETLLKEKQRVAEAVALNKEASDNLEIENEIAKARRAGIKPGESAMGTPGQGGAVTELENKLAQKRARDAESKAKRGIGYTEEAAAAAAGRAQFSTQQQVEANIQLTKSEENKLAISKENFNLLNSIGALSAKAVIDANAQFAIEEANRASAQTTFDKKIAFDKEADALKAKISTQPEGSPEALAILAQIALNKKYDDDSIAGEAALLTAKLSGITTQQTYNTLLDAQKTTMEKMVDTTSNLTTVFGELGTSIGKAGEAILNMAQEDTMYLEQKKALQAAQKDPKLSVKEQATATESLIKLEQKHSKDKLKNEALVLGSVKKIFGEETAGYKAIAAYEKVTSAIKIFNDNKELAITIFNLGKKAAMELGFLSTSVSAEASADMAKATSKIPAVIMEFMTWLGPWGTAAAGIAIAAALSGGGGGGGTYTPPIDQGTMAGTGQQVGTDGQTIGTRAGGVLGDPKAEVKSIADSIDMLSQVFFDNMGDTSSNLIKSLKGIQENTYNTAKALGSSGVLGGGDNPFGASVGSRANAQTGIALIDKTLSWLGLGGGGTSTSITGSGIMGAGTATGFAKGQQTLQGYTDVSITEERPWWEFRGPETTSRRIPSELDDSVNKAVEGIFSSFNETLLASAEGLGQTTAGIQAILDKEILKLTVSKVGLTGTEFAQKLTAEVNIQLNKLADLAYPFLAQYTKVGEESWMVAAKLIKDGETVNFGLSMVSKSFENLGMGSEALVATQQQVIKNFGGTADAFASAIQAYYAALFSDEEKAAFATSNVQTQLEKLGVTGITTKNQLKDLIATKDPTSEIYAKLVKIAPAFASAIDGAQSLADEVKNIADALASSITDQEIKIYGLLGKSSTALAMTREKELAAIEEVLRPRQKYINALTDEVALRDKLKTAYTTSNNALTASIKTLSDYKNALLVGASSTLSPAEKYAQAKSMLMQTATAAQAVITASSTAAEIAARDIALGKLPAAADALLSTSKEVNASGAQYAADFASATSAIDSTASILSTQQTDMQTQLGYLEITATSTETMAQLLSDYLTAQQTTALAQADAVASGSTAATFTIPGHAKGGLAKGISLVGENGPEIVDFTNPGRVYSNKASNDLFNTKELVAEIKALRTEVSQLREDQNKQTGALINSNFEANAKNAEVITNAAQTTANQQDWKTRSQVKVA